MAHITQFGVADAKKFRDLCHLYPQFGGLDKYSKARSNQNFACFRRSKAMLSFDIIKKLLRIRRLSRL